MAAAHSLAEEKRRPRESGFGSLSAGLIERGKVPLAELCPEPAANDAGAAAPETRVGPAFGPAFEIEREWLVPSAEAVAQAQAERTRTRESSFGSLGDGFIERGGALSRQILSQAQIELLLAPEPFEIEALSSLAEEVETPEAAAAAEIEPESTEAPAETARVNPLPKPDLLPVPQEPSKPIPTPQDFYRAALAETESVAETAPPRRWLRSVAIWTVSLLVAGVASWLLMEMPELPSFARPPVPQAEARLPALPELPPMPPLPDMPSAVEPPAATETPPTAPAIEAADEVAPAPSVDPIPVQRRRPGAAPEEPVPEAVPPPPPELTAAPPPVAAPAPTVEPKKKAKASRAPKPAIDEAR